MALQLYLAKPMTIKYKAEVQQMSINPTILALESSESITAMQVGGQQLNRSVGFTDAQR